MNDAIVKRTPWWAISLGLHALGALVLGFLMIAAGPADTLIVTTVRATPAEPTPPVEFRDPLVRMSPLRSDAPAEDVVSAETDPIETDPSEFETASTTGDAKAQSESPFRSTRANTSIGVGGPPGGKKGNGIGDRETRRKMREKRDDGDVDAVRGALAWLARHQGADGGWGVQAHAEACRGGRCETPDSASGDFDLGVSGLACLAFLGAGYTHLSKDVLAGREVGDVLRKGLQYLIARQDVEGFLGPRSGHKDLYNHAVGTLALGEAYGLTASSLVREPAQRAVDYLVRAQNPGRGWRYSSRGGDNDTSVTGWAVMALKSAELSGLSFPRTAYDGARAWLDEATDEAYGRAGYTHKGTGKVFCPHNAGFDHQETLTSIAVMSRIFMDRKADARVRAGAELAARDIPSNLGSKVDYYAWYAAALALFQFDGPEGPLWSKWNPGMLKALLGSQKREGCEAGSWDPNDRWGCEAGRVYATALNALTLEVYYRYDNVLGGRRK